MLSNAAAGYFDNANLTLVGIFQGMVAMQSAALQHRAARLVCCLRYSETNRKSTPAFTPVTPVSVIVSSP